MRGIAIIYWVFPIVLLYSCGNKKEEALYQQALEEDAQIFSEKISRSISVLFERVSERGNRPFEVQASNDLKEIHHLYRAFWEKLLVNDSSEVAVNTLLAMQYKTLQADSLISGFGFTPLDTTRISPSLALYLENPGGPAKQLLLNAVSHALMDYVHQRLGLVGALCKFGAVPVFGYTSYVKQVDGGNLYRIVLLPVDPYVIENALITYGKPEVGLDCVNLSYADVGNALWIEFKTKYRHNEFSFNCPVTLQGEYPSQRRTFDFKVKMTINQMDYK